MGNTCDERNYEITITARNKMLSDIIVKDIGDSIKLNDLSLVNFVTWSYCGPIEFEIRPLHDDEFPAFTTVRFPLHTETEFNKANNYNIVITCPSTQDAAIVAAYMHMKLVGFDDYINNRIVLTLDSNVVYLCIGAECDVYPKLCVVKSTKAKTVDGNVCAKSTNPTGWVFDPAIRVLDKSWYPTGDIYATSMLISGVDVMAVDMITELTADNFIKSALGPGGSIYKYLDTTNNPIRDYATEELGVLSCSNLKCGDYIVNNNGMVWLVLGEWQKLRCMEDNNEKAEN